MTVDSSSNVLVFTDLDGTLLDHKTYSFAKAKPALAMIKEKGIPIFLASSKTALELVPLREEMGIADFEAIVENGAGILDPNVPVATGNSGYSRIIDYINRCPQKLRNRFSGFSDWTVDEVVAKTGLSHDQAKCAKMRFFSEPVEWNGSELELQAFNAYLAAGGYTMQRGGRFFSISKGDTKASQMHKIVKRYAIGKSMFTLALGDGENDIEMLEQADLGIIIPNPAHVGIRQLPGEQQGTIVRALDEGPVGWNRSVTEFIGRLGD